MKTTTTTDDQPVITWKLELRDLSDEEIEEVFYSLEVGHSLNDFARAILKKASEK